MNKIVKKGLVVFTALATLWCVGTVCSAEIIPPSGPGQIGPTAVVLCETLTVHQEADVASASVDTLHYGDRMMVVEQKDGWAEFIRSDDVDAEAEGWVNADFIAINPAWYRTEAETPVFAWNDTTAPKVAHLSKDTTLPILKDDGEWLVVSLRGAAGWIHK